MGPLAHANILRLQLQPGCINNEAEALLNLCFVEEYQLCSFDAKPLNVCSETALMISFETKGVKNTCISRGYATRLLVQYVRQKTTAYETLFMHRSRI